MLATSLSLLALLPLPLTDRLASPSYRVRDRAHRGLAALGRLAVPHLERTAASHPSPEARARCHVLLRPYAEEIAGRATPHATPARPCGNPSGPGDTTPTHTTAKRPRAGWACTTATRPRASWRPASGPSRSCSSAAGARRSWRS